MGNFFFRLGDLLVFVKDTLLSSLLPLNVIASLFTQLPGVDDIGDFQSGSVAKFSKVSGGGMRSFFFRLGDLLAFFKYTLLSSQ